LKTTDKPQEEVEEIRAKAEDLLQQIRGGADFAEMAKQHSEDTGTAVNGGELDWIARGQTVQNFEQTAFSLEPNQISDVVSTEYGFHIIQLLDKERAQLRPFDEVKEELAEERKTQSVYERMEKLADEAHAELVKNPSNAEQIGSRLGLTFVNVEKGSLRDTIPEVGADPDFEDAIASLAKGRVTPVMQVEGNKLVVAAVTDIFPARPLEFSEAEERVRDQLISEKAQAMVQERRSELEERVKTAGDDLHKLARALSLTVNTSPEFTREESVDGLGAATYMRQAFDEPVGAIVGPIDAMGQTFVCKVISRAPADMSKLPEEREAIFNALKTMKAQQRRELFEDGVLTQLIKEGKVKINDRTVQNLISAYRG